MLFWQCWVSIWFTGSVVSHLVHRILSVVLGDVLAGKVVIYGILVPLIWVSSHIRADDQVNEIMYGFLAMAGAFYAFRAYQCCAEPRLMHEPLIYRMFHVGCTFHDIQACKRNISYQERVEELKHAMKHLIMNGVGISICVTIFYYARYLPMAMVQRLAVYFCGGFYALFSLNAFGLVIQLLMATFGLKMPKLMDHPLSSTSLQEFWGKRWDVVIQQILQHYIYLPLRKRYHAPRHLAVLASFIGSSCIHIYPLFVGGLDYPHSLEMAGYFLSQCLLLFVEEQMSVRKGWTNENLKWTWTMCCVSIPLPLIVGPTLSLAGVTAV